MRAIDQTTEKFSDLSSEQFAKLVSLGKLVLVDFYKKDCVQCEIQEPILNEIKEEMGDRIKIIRFNFERNESLQELPVKMVPSQLLYHEGVLMWCNNGVINKKKFNDISFDLL